MLNPLPNEGTRRMPDRWNRSAWLVWVVALATMAAACGGVTGDSDATGEGEPISVGYIFPNSGPFAASGPAMRAAGELAVAAINESGGVLGRPIELSLSDYASDPNKARQETERLVSEGVPVIIAEMDSAAREAAAPVAESRGVVFIYPVLYEGGGCGDYQIFLGETAGTLFSPTIPYLMETHQGTSWYIIGSDYVYPQTVEGLAAETIEGAGGEVLGSELVPLGTSDFSSSIQKIRAVDPDFVLTNLVDSDALAFEQQLFDFGLSQDYVRLTGTYDTALVAEIPEALDGVYFAQSFFAEVETPEIQTFIASYKEEYGEAAPNMSTYAAHGYVALEVWAAAANAAGTLDAGPVLEEMLTRQFDSFIGVISIDENRHASQPVYLAQVGDGELRVVEEFPEVAPNEPCSAGIPSD